MIYKVAKGENVEYFNNNLAFKVHEVVRITIKKDPDKFISKIIGKWLDDYRRET